MKHSSPTVCGKCGTTFTEYDHDQPGLCLDCWELWDTECWAKSPLGKLEGENAALRAEIEALRGKVNDLDAFLAEWERLGSGIEILPKIVRMRIRELGLITEARDGE